MTDLIQVIYARKPFDKHEVISGSRPDSGDSYPTRVIETKEMTEVEYDAFLAAPMSRREWMGGKGGWTGDIRKAIAIVAPNRETLYVDPSGYDYARYVGRAVPAA